MIWRHSANLPQVIGVKRTTVNKSMHLIPTAPHCQQRRACKEARSEVTKAIWPLVCRCHEHHKACIPSIIFNSRTHTLWLTTITDDEFYDELELLSDNQMTKKWTERYIILTEEARNSL